MQKKCVRLALCAAVMAVVMGGCATTQPFKPKPVLNWSQPEKRIVIVQPDMVLGLVTTGGVTEPQADWTQSAHALFVANFARHIGAKGISSVSYDTLTDPRDGQLIKLYSLLMAGGNQLGTRNNLRLATELQDTLGPGVQAMGNRFGADYGVFFYLRDNYTSTGRVLANVATNIVLAALTGGRVQRNYSDASRFARVSLVDLRTGAIVWTNSWSDASGDLRENEDAGTFADNLLKDMPL